MILLCGLLAAGCSSAVDPAQVRAAQGSVIGVTIDGAPGAPPIARIAPPVRVDRTASEVLVAGTGPPIVVDQLFVLQLALYNARTGAKVRSSYDAGQRPLAAKSTDGRLFPALADALVGVRQGSRILMTLTPEDGYGPAGLPDGVGAGDALILIADVIAVPPAEVLDAVAGVPSDAAAGVRVRERFGVPDRVEFDGTPPPGQLLVVPLLTGDGPAIETGDLVVAHSLGQVWGRRFPFDDNFPKEPALVAVGTGTVIEGWDQGLVGIRGGSRILLIAPPELAYKETGNPPAVPGGATVVYVIDILGVS